MAGLTPAVEPSERPYEMPKFHSVYRRDLFAGRVALITGGGTGIGLRIAREFVYLGGTVMLASRKRYVLESAAVAIERDMIETKAGAASDKDSKTTSHPPSRRVFVCEVNIRDADSVKACVRYTVDTCGGRIDYLVNNGGGQFPSPAANMSEKGWRAVIDTNLTGTFLMMTECYRQSFALHNTGCVVNILADMQRGFPIMAHTGAARSAVDNLTKSLAVEWAKAGVRVNSVLPGVIASDGLDRYPEAFKQQMLSNMHKVRTSLLSSDQSVCSICLFVLPINQSTHIVCLSDELRVAVWYNGRSQFAGDVSVM